MYNLAAIVNLCCLIGHFLLYVSFVLEYMKYIIQPSIFVQVSYVQ